MPAPTAARANVSIPTVPSVAEKANASPIPPKLAATLSSASQVARRAGSMREMNQATGAPTTSEMVAQTTPSSIEVMIARWSLRLEKDVTQLDTLRLPSSLEITLLASSSSAGAMSSARASRMSGMAGSHAASHPLTTRPTGRAGGRTRAAGALRTDVEVLTLAGQHLAVPGLGDLLRVDLGPILHLLDVLVLVVRQPLRLGVVR